MTLVFFLEMNQLQQWKYFAEEYRRFLEENGSRQRDAPITNKDASKTEIHEGAVLLTVSKIHNRPEATNKMLKQDAYTVDELCGKCRTIKAKKHQTCGSLIYRTAFQRNISLLEAARIEVEEAQNTECRPCLPEYYPKHSQKLWQYDQKAPVIQRSHFHHLSSIPEELRVPSEHLTALNKDHSFETIAEYFGSVDHKLTRQYLFDYNPSLVKIPTKQHLEISGEKPVYLASYRVSTQQSCFPANTTLAMIGGSWEKKPRQQDYLGLALLRNDLSIIQDVVLQLPKTCG
mgnify:CR=1 FL=1